MAKTSTQSQKQLPKTKQKTGGSQKFIRNAGLIGVLGLILLVFVFYPKQDAPEVAPARLSDNPTKGTEDAPVVLTEFGDFTCSTCRSWHQAGVVDQILNQYEGLVRVEWRDFPIITADSPKAAEAGQCAYDQGLFWEYLDRVYNEPGSSFTNGEIADLRRYAAEVGLNMELFNNCLDDNQHKATVEYDFAEARRLNLPGTPSFLVNGKPIIGANPQLVIQAIEDALAANSD